MNHMTRRQARQCRVVQKPTWCKANRVTGQQAIQHCSPSHQMLVRAQRHNIRVLVSDVKCTAARCGRHRADSEQKCVNSRLAD